MKEVKFTKGIPICPNCDKPTVRTIGYSTSTCLGYTPVYDENGDNVSQDMNTVTSNYYCQGCNNHFATKSQGKNTSYIENYSHPIALSVSEGTSTTHSIH